MLDWWSAVMCDRPTRARGISEDLLRRYTVIITVRCKPSVERLVR